MERYANKSGFYIVLVLVLFVMLLGRLVQLQLYDRDTYFRESEKNRIREVVIPPSRGLIYDRHGEVLVDNRPTYSISVIPYEFLKSAAAVTLLARILSTDRTLLITQIKKKKLGNFNPVKIKRNVDFQILSKIEEHRLDLPGVFYNIEFKRYYPGGVAAPHLFGYLGEITADELELRRNTDYRMGDLIGKNGIELQYEGFLRGLSGLEYLEVDVLGREVRDLSEFGARKPVPGTDLVLTLDAPIQRFLESSFKDKKGAAVVLDPRNGDVLALVSKPDFDPEIFSNPLTNKIWDSLINDEGKPLYNRSCQSLYPPGSTYKLVLAAAGLETRLIDPDATVHCAGSYRLGRRWFDCWKVKGHGDVAFYQAIEQSCNVYFYTMGLRVGLDNWAEYSRRLQFGAKTAIDLPNESAGLVPTRDYFDDRYGKGKWTDGFLLNLSVGQGDLLTTPLQLARFAMIIGNEGRFYEPRLLKKIVSPASASKVFVDSDTMVVQGITKRTLKSLKYGMSLVVNGDFGTAKVARMPGMKVCGKTGTAQNPHGESHAWFIGFAPMDKPEIALCILVENGGSGGAVAAPIAKGVLMEYFQTNLFAQQQDLQR